MISYCKRGNGIWNTNACDFNKVVVCPTQTGSCWVRLLEKATQQRRTYAWPGLGNGLRPAAEESSTGSNHSNSNHIVQRSRVNVETKGLRI